MSLKEQTFEVCDGRRQESHCILQVCFFQRLQRKLAASFQPLHKSMHNATLQEIAG